MDRLAAKVKPQYDALAQNCAKHRRFMRTASSLGSLRGGSNIERL
jgi:hypothetical protein